MGISYLHSNCGAGARYPKGFGEVKRKAQGTKSATGQMGDIMGKMARISRPRKMICPGCGTEKFLGNCGVKEHEQRKLTLLRATLEGKCNGYVYIHVENGGMECPNL